MNTYEKQATDFLAATDTTFEVKFDKNDFHFAGDKERRDIYAVTFKRGQKLFRLKFGQSINDTGKGIAPTAYDVLACLTKNDPGTFEDFCSEFGYEQESRRAEKTYKATCKEWADVCRLWSDAEIEQMQGIA